MNDSELVEIRIIGIPLVLHRVAAEHQDGLKREFALLAKQADAEPAGVPTRLLSLSLELNQRFAAFSAGPFADLEAALERGEESLDLVFHLPPTVGPAARQLGDLLAEADAYCAAGEDLLTLVPPGNAVAYRNWFIDEFERQARGEAPRPWSEIEE